MSTLTPPVIRATVTGMTTTGAERARVHRERLAAANGTQLRKPGRPRTADHGDPARWNSGCRCTLCREGQRRRMAAYRAARRASVTVVDHRPGRPS